MSTYQNSSSKHFRAASYQQDTSSYSAASSTEEFLNHNTGHMKRYISKFEEPNEKSNNASKQQDFRSFSAQKSINDTSYSDLDQKCRETDDFASKAEMPRRISNLEYKVQELTQKITREIPRSSEARQEDIGRVNDRVLCIERRMDTMDRKLEKLTTTLETFMQKFQVHLTSKEELLTTPDEKRSSLSYGNMRREIVHENGERLTEIKLLGGNNAVKDAEPENETEQKSYMNNHRRTQSRDNFDVRDRVREALDQARKKDEIIAQAKQSEDRSRNNFVEPKVFAVEQPERNRVPAKLQEKQVERFGTRESPEPKGPPKQLKASLRSPDTARKRKNVSWSENCVSEGNFEEENGQKRKRMDTSDSSDFGRYNFEQKRDEAESAKRGRETVEDKYRQNNVRVGYGGKEEDGYEKQMKFTSGEARTEKIKSEVEKLEEKLRRIETNGRGDNTSEKERQLEEKRRKIDEEIQRRINKQNETKKRMETNEMNPRRVTQFEDELKTNSCSNDLSNYKDSIPRNELISKYADISASASKRCKNV